MTSASSLPLSVPVDAVLATAPSPAGDEVMGAAPATVIEMDRKEEEERKEEMPRASPEPEGTDPGSVPTRPSQSWQITLESFEDKKVPIPRHPSKKVRYFYKRQNEIIDNLIAWHDNLGKIGDEAMEGVFTQYYYIGELRGILAPLCFLKNMRRSPGPLLARIARAIFSSLFSHVCR